jgi:hypothetical protein
MFYDVMFIKPSFLDALDTKKNPILNIRFHPLEGGCATITCLWRADVQKIHYCPQAEAEVQSRGTLTFPYSGTAGCRDREG